MKRGDESCAFEEGKKKDEREREKGRAHAHEVRLMRQGIVGPIQLSKITKMPHNSVFHSLKTLKMCFQFS